MTAAHTSISLSVDEAAELLHVQPDTVRRRVARGELHTDANGRVTFRPSEDWLRVEDAAAMLEVAPATVRANITAGRLTGRREKGGRWRVRLQSVLEDPRAAGAAAVFAGEARGDLLDAPPRRRRGQHARAVYVRLDADEAELLERAVDRHGTQRAAVVHGLRAIDDDAAGTAVDLAELRAELDVVGGHRDRAVRAHRALAEHARGRLVDELYCHRCEKLVPIAEVDELELEDGGAELYHRKHGHRAAGKVRGSTVIARRGPLELE